jgi:hypothetical protein
MQASTSSTESTTDDRNFVYDNAPTSQESATSSDRFTKYFLHEDDAHAHINPIQSDITLATSMLIMSNIGDLTVECNGVEWHAGSAIARPLPLAGSTTVHLEKGTRNQLKRS